MSLDLTSLMKAVESLTKALEVARPDNLANMPEDQREMIEITQRQMDTIRKILAEHVPDCETRAFGSRVNSRAKNYSDLDLAIVGEDKLDFDRLRLLKEAFEESDLPFRVDIIDWNDISPEFRAHIEKHYETIKRSDNC